MPLAEPVIVSEFWANRRGKSVRVQFREYEGATLIDIRKHYTASDGTLRPTAKGIALALRRLPELAAAINKAVTRAHELGLLDPAKLRQASISGERS